MHKDYDRFPHAENSNQIIKENIDQDLPIIITMAYKDNLINRLETSLPLDESLNKRNRCY